MKKILWLAVACLFLSSCGKSPSSEVQFIHAIGLDSHENGVKLSAVLEGAKKEKDSEYFCVSFTAGTAEEAFGKLQAEYNKCYSGTAQTCFFGETLTRRSLYDSALFICESPLIPSDSNAVSVSSVTAETLLQNIKTGNDIKTIKKLCENEKINTAGFFALCTSADRTVKLCALTYDGQIKSDEPVYYRNCAIVQSQYFGLT